MTKKQKSTPDTHQETPQQNLTITTALDQILTVSLHSELEEEKLMEAADSFAFLKKTLSFTPIQSLVIGMLIDADCCLSTKHMASYLKVNNIKFMKHMDELEDLVNRKIIRKTILEEDMRTVYEIREGACKKYVNNEVYTAPKRNKLTLVDFLEITKKLFTNRSESRISRDELEEEFDEITKLNQKLFVCKQAKKLESTQRLFFYYCVYKFSLESMECISPDELEDACDALKLRRLASSLKNGTDALITQKLIQPSGIGYFNDGTNYIVSDEVRRLLMTELNIEPSNDKEESRRGLKKHDTITSKKLFYNEVESDALEDLTEILMPENFKGVQQRLEEHGMRKGFACLFYGPPGTGKTESVLQIARATGRDIMEVDISNIKSKWVGDSERNIKMLFERYQNYCENCDELPILLFNEADAIISKRMSDVERSVDKMENAIQNIILEEMEQLDGILIATTNLTSNMDQAFERRFLYKIEFNKPEMETRTKIWQSMLSDLSKSDAQTLASAYDFSGGQIENIVRKNIVNTILHNEPTRLLKLREYCDAELLDRNCSKRNRIGFYQ